MGTGRDFAKSEDRHKEFIASGLPLAKAFAECWKRMRTETGALAGSDFEAARRMALLSHDEPLREAFDLDIPSDFFITILTQDSSARA